MQSSLSHLLFSALETRYKTLYCKWFYESTFKIFLTSYSWLDALMKCSRPCILFLIQVPHSHIPCGEAGSGLYSSKVLDTMACINELVPIALHCVRSTSSPGKTFTIADYGSADGGVSMPIIYSCVEELRKLHGNELEILIYYEDQPVNDFTSLFSYIQGTNINLSNCFKKHSVAVFSSTIYFLFNIKIRYIASYMTNLYQS